MNFTPKDIREGKKRLKEWLPKIRKSISLKDTSLSVQSGTQVGNDILSRVKFKNLEALVIYKDASKKGWHADLIMKGLPRGVGNRIGTPVSMPCETREKALRAGKTILRTVVRTCMENEIAIRDTKDANVRHFELYGYSFPIPGEAIDKIAEIADRLGPDVIGDQETHIERLKMNLTDIMREPGIFDEEKWQQASDEACMKVVANMASLLVMGEFRFPREANFSNDGPEVDGP